MLSNVLKTALSDDITFNNYGVFFNKIIPYQEVKLSNRDKLKLRNFYKYAKSLDKKSRRSPEVASELQRIINNINFEAARARKLVKSQKSIEAPQDDKGAYFKKVRASLEFDKNTTKLDDLINSRKDLPIVGLGLSPTTKIPKVKANEVVLDKHTDQISQNEKHILYTAGWSIDGCFIKDDEEIS